MEFNFKISSRIKILPIDPLFSSWVNVIKKAPIINRSRNSNSLKGISFFFEIRKLRFFKKVGVFHLIVLCFIIYLYICVGRFFHEKVIKGWLSNCESVN